jgi:hypothetical protein
LAGSPGGEYGSGAPRTACGEDVSAGRPLCYAAQPASLRVARQHEHSPTGRLLDHANLLARVAQTAEQSMEVLGDLYFYNGQEDVLFFSLILWVQHERTHTQPQQAHAALVPHAYNQNYNYTTTQRLEDRVLKKKTRIDATSCWLSATCTPESRVQDSLFYGKLVSSARCNFFSDRC